MNPVLHAVNIIGTQAALARLCMQKPQAVTRWIREGRVPAKYARTIEAATGISCVALCPDVFGEADFVAPAKRVA